MHSRFKYIFSCNVINNLEDNDTYKTLRRPSEEVLFKDKNSKFLGYAFPVHDEEEVKSHIDSLKKKHHSARHWCYAWQLGKEDIQYRVNDDGEPGNSAGQPIYGQIQAYGITDVLIVIVRYYGGIKLGVGGLMNAYKTASKMALEASDIVEKTIDIKFLIVTDYENIHKVMRVIKEKRLDVIHQKMEMDCQVTISVRKKEADQTFTIFHTIYGIFIKPLTD